MAEPDQTVVPLEQRPVDFRKPPVNEVYLMVQTKTDFFPAANVGLLVRTHAERFPKIQTHPLSARVIEPRPGKHVAMKLEVTDQLGQRLWMVNEDETQLIQIQADRFVYNWRQVPDHLEYPRYTSVRKGFLDEISALLRAAKIDPQVEDFIDLCEVAYTNVIDIPDADDVRREVQRVFRCAPQPSLDLVDRLKSEETTFTWTYTVDNEQGEFVGRLRVITLGVRNRLTQRFAFHTQLVFRGQPSAPTIPSAMDFFDRGHLAIVRAFKAITTDEMHALWEEER